MRRSVFTPKRLATSLLFTAGVASLPGVAAQTPRIYSVGIPVEVEYDSNPNMVVGNGPSTTWFRVKPNFSATQVTGQEEFSLEGGLSAEKSSNADVAKDRVDPRLRGVWKHADSLNTTQLALLLERQALRSLDIRERVPVGVDGSRTLYAVSGSWNRDLNERTSLGTSLRHESARYSVGNTPDYRDTVGSIRLTRLQNERRSWYGELNGQQYRSDTAQDPIRGTVGGTHSNVVGALVGVNQLLTERLRVNANAGWMHFNQAGSRSDWQGSVLGEYAAERWLASAEVARFAGVNSTVGTLSVTDEVRLRARYALTPVSRIDFNYGYSREQTDNTKRSIANLAYARQLHPSWELTVRASRREQEVIGGTAKSNLLALVLVYSNPDF